MADCTRAGTVAANTAPGEFGRAYLVHIVARKYHIKRIGKRAGKYQQPAFHDIALLTQAFFGHKCEDHAHVGK